MTNEIARMNLGVPLRLPQGRLPMVIAAEASVSRASLAGEHAHATVGVDGLALRDHAGQSPVQSRPQALGPRSYPIADTGPPAPGRARPHA